MPSGHVNDVPISQLHPTIKNRHTETEQEQFQPHMTGNVINAPAYQQILNMQIAQLLAQQQQHALALTLPTPKVPTFSGNPIDIHGFVQAFEQLIEQKTSDDSARLYYLIHVGRCSGTKGWTIRYPGRGGRKISPARIFLFSWKLRPNFFFERFWRKIKKSGMLSTKTTTLTPNFLPIHEYIIVYLFYYCYIIKYTLSSLESQITM